MTLTLSPTAPLCPMRPSKTGRHLSVQLQRASLVGPHSDLVHHLSGQQAIGTGCQHVLGGVELTVSSRSSVFDALLVAATNSNSESSLARVSGVEIRPRRTRAARDISKDVSRRVGVTGSNIPSIAPTSEVIERSLSAHRAMARYEIMSSVIAIDMSNVVIACTRDISSSTILSVFLMVAS
jgi:hypothetical protein